MTGRRSLDRVVARASMTADLRAHQDRDRLDWYLREHGRPPTPEELHALRAHRKGERRKAREAAQP